MRLSASARSTLTVTQSTSRYVIDHETDTATYRTDIDVDIITDIDGSQCEVRRGPICMQAQENIGHIN